MISARIWLRSFASRFESGSSISSTLGLLTMARPMATRSAPAAGERLGLAVEELGDIKDLCRLAHAAVDLVVGHFLEMRLAVRIRLRDLLELEREGDVFIDGHVRIKRIVLEDHRDVAVFGRDVVHLLAVDEELAAADLLETGDHAQRGRLAAAARADFCSISNCSL